MKLRHRVSAIVLTAVLVLGLLPGGTALASEEGQSVPYEQEQEEESEPAFVVEEDPIDTPIVVGQTPVVVAEEPTVAENDQTVGEEDPAVVEETPAVEEEDPAVEEKDPTVEEEIDPVGEEDRSDASEEPLEDSDALDADLDGATDGASITLTNVELDIPDGVNDRFTYYIYVWTIGSDGSIKAVTGSYKDADGNVTLTLISSRYTYMQAYNNGLPYTAYYNYFGVGRVTLTAGQSVTITGLPEGCSYMILAAASQNYYVKSLTATYGTVDAQVGKLQVDNASGANTVVCVNDYAPNSLQISQDVMSSDPDSDQDVFVFTIYLYSHSSDGDTPLFEGEYVDVEIATDGANGAEAPYLGNGDTLTFHTETAELAGLSGTGTYNVAQVKLKAGQSVVLKNLGSDYGCYVYQTPELHYTLYKLQYRHVYTNDMDEFVSTYDGYYCYTNGCSVSASIGFTNAQETLSITKEVENGDTDREFVFRIYFLQYVLEAGMYTSMAEGEFNLSYTNPTGDEPATATAQLGTDHSLTSTFTINSTNSTGQTYDMEWTAMEVKVAAGQTVTIEDLPAVIWCYIMEVPVTGYTLTDMTFDADSPTYNYNNCSVHASAIDTDVAATFTNTYTPPTDGADLTVSKVVTSNYDIDTEKAFSFTVQLTDQDGNALSDQDIQVLLPGAAQAVLRGTDEDGKLSVSLKHGQSVTFQDLPLGTGYTITENDAGNYTTTFAVTGGTADEPGSKTQSGVIDSADGVTVQVTNELFISPPTGIREDIQPALVMTALALGGFGLLGATGKKKHKRWG
jgi:hypothetical protein